MSLQPSTIAIGSQILLGDDDVNDVEWGFSTIDGWHKPAGMDVERVKRAISHGEFAQAGRRTGRVITVNGWLWAEDRAKINAALSHLAALLADGGFDTFTFDDSDYSLLSTEVQLLDLDADWEHGTQSDPPRYQLQLLAASPYKFGAVDSDTVAIGGGGSVTGVGLRFPLFDAPVDGSLYFGGAVTPPDPPGIATISNPGTADASVILSVAGPTPAEGFTMTDFDSNLSVTYLGPAIQAGSQIVFDGADGTVLSDGSDVSGYAVVEAWPVVPANGGSLTILFQSLGEDTGAELTVSAYSTYW